MNTKSILLAGAMSLGIVSLAKADTTNYVYMTGSTAGRAAVYATMTDGGGTSVFDAAPTAITQGGTSAGGSTYMSFYGHLIGDAVGVTTAIKCHWSGSEGGISDLIGTPATELFLDDAAASDLTGASPNATVSSAVDLCAADNAKLYSKNPTAPVTQAFVAVIPFKWVKEKGSADALTAVTDQTIRAAINGNAKLSLFTGNVADTTRVFVSGRDSNSGTRVNAFGVSGFGIRTAPKMVQINADGSMKDQTGGGVYLGDFGYPGGGALATQMGYDLTQATSKDVAPLGDGSSHFSVIAYLGMSDANAAVTAGGTVVTNLNGVPFSISAIEQGQYNFWGNYHVMKKSAATAQATAVYNQLKANTGIPAHADDTSLIKLSSMTATRSGPTGDPVR